MEDLRGRISRIDIGPLRGKALRVAIERPACDLGVYFEPELVERLLGDAASEPGILPLLQETLIQLWDRRRLQLLTLADYVALGDGGRGGLAVAISRRADATLRALSPAQEAIARRILLRLVSFGEGRSDIRRQQRVSALRAINDRGVDFDVVLQRLIGDRLIAGAGDGDGDESRVDLAHKRRRIRWLVVGTILLLAVTAATAISVARTQELELQRDVLRTNAYEAHALAGAVAFHLREEVDAAVATAADPSVVRALPTLDEEALEQRRIGTPFDTIALYDRSGTARVQASPAINHRRNIGKDYSWRDYFIGARRLGQAGLRAGYISRAVLSETEGIWVFGIAAPVYDEGTWAGVLLTTIGTDSALGRRRLDRASDDGPMAVVVAPRDRSRATMEGAGEYVVILHDGLTHGAGIVMDSPRLREFRVTRTEHNQLRGIDPEPITDDAHRDPVPGFEVILRG